MEEPNLQVFTKPLSEEDRIALVPILHEDYDFVFGFSFVARDVKTLKVVELPPSIGQWVQEASYSNTDTGFDLDEQESVKSLIDCRDVISREIMETGDPALIQDYSNGRTYCLDPKTAKWSKFNDGIGNGDVDTNVLLNLCYAKKGNDCIEISEWVKDKVIVMKYFIKTKMKLRIVTLSW